MYAFLCLCVGVTVLYRYTHTKQPDTHMVIEKHTLFAKDIYMGI